MASTTSVPVMNEEATEAKFTARASLAPAMRPITIAVIGGFGNQLFQFAAARSLAESTGRGMQLCFRRSDSPWPRRALRAIRSAFREIISGADERFRLKALIRSHDIARVQSEAKQSDPREDRSRGLNRRSLRSAFNDPSVQIAGIKILRQPADVATLLTGTPLDADVTPLIAGYMQGDRFVAPQLDALRRAITLPTDSPYCAHWIPRLADRPTVGVHVRRGDYLNPGPSKRLHTLPIWWFERAAAIAAERAGGKVRFAVFTDEPAWVREHLRLPGETVMVSGQGSATGLEDFTVLSSCAHHIIANSTFGWWAARLSAGSGMVIAPTRWWTSRELPNDYLPAAWQTLENLG